MGEATARPRGGKLPPHVEMRDLLLMIVESDPTITVQCLNNLLRGTWPDRARVSNAIISRAQHNCLIAIKQMRNIRPTGTAHLRRTNGMSNIRKVWRAVCLSHLKCDMSRVMCVFLNPRKMNKIVLFLNHL